MFARPFITAQRYKTSELMTLEVCSLTFREQAVMLPAAALTLSSSIVSPRVDIGSGAAMAPPRSVHPRGPAVAAVKCDAAAAAASSIAAAGSSAWPDTCFGSCD